MSYAVSAWREKNGKTGITIGTVMPVGWDNHVSEILLVGDEVREFILECQAAARRAALATAPFEEPMPGAYDNWENRKAAPR